MQVVPQSILILIIGGVVALMAVVVPPALVSYSAPGETAASLVTELPTGPANEVSATTTTPYHAVPFYSQFYDISDPAWRKVGCGIASVAMLISYHTDNPMDVDALLATGIAADAFLPAAGWTHAGLIDLARPYGLTGASQSLAHLSGDEALARLRTVVAAAPVMASVHYTFEPTNPIPHLVVVTGIDDTNVYYNDPAEPTGKGVISVEQFQRAWKQRYISIVPVAG